jgi:hypothetical protein
VDKTPVIMGSDIRDNGSSTTVIEQPIQLQTVKVKQDLPTISSSTTPSGGRSLNDDNPNDLNETLPSPVTATEAVETWRNPRINLYRFPATLWAFTVVRPDYLEPSSYLPADIV